MIVTYTNDSQWEFQNYSYMHLSEALVIKCEMSSGKRGLNPFQNDKVLESSKLKEFVDDNSNFNLNVRRLTNNFSFSYSVFNRLVMQT